MTEWFEEDTGHALYQSKYPGNRFKLICATNQYWIENAHRIAASTSGDLVDKEAIGIMLRNHKVTISDLQKYL